MNTTIPTPQELAEAMKALSEELDVAAQAPKDWRVQLRQRHASTLLAHARAPRLTEAQREALKTAQIILDGLCDEYPGYRGDAFNFRVAFAGELGEVGK